MVDDKSPGAIGGLAGHFRRVSGADPFDGPLTREQGEVTGAGRHARLHANGKAHPEKSLDFRTNRLPSRAGAIQGDENSTVFVEVQQSFEIAGAESGGKQIMQLLRGVSGHGPSLPQFPG